MLRGAVGDVKNVQVSTGGRFRGGLLAGVVRSMVSINDVVVPIALAGLKGRVLELEGALPGTRLGRGLVLGERELADVVVPGAEEMNCLDGGGNAEGKGELLGRHNGRFELLSVFRCLECLLLTVLQSGAKELTVGVVVGCLTDAVELNDCLNAACACEQGESTMVDVSISECKCCFKKQNAQKK